MAGRGNRSPGTLSAHIYLTYVKKGLDVKAILNENSKENIADWIKIIKKLQSSNDKEKDIFAKIVAATANIALTKLSIAIQETQFLKWL